MEKMGLPLQKPEEKYTCADYLTWPDEERWELLEGTAYSMSPGPNTAHQRLCGELFYQFKSFLQDKSCEVFLSPFDVYLPAGGETDFNRMDTVVQPDLSVICDPVKIIEKGCLGAPDLIVEILSPSTSKKDLSEKFRLYEKHGVREYWVVDPGNRFVQIFHLITEGKNRGRYDAGELIPPAGRYEKNTIAASRVLEGFRLDVVEIFKD